MPSDQEKLTIKGLIEKILEPHSGIMDLGSRRQARFTTLISLNLAAISLFSGIISIVFGFGAAITISLIVLAIIMGVACALGRSYENYVAGSIILISGIILGGFLLSPAAGTDQVAIFILLATIVPALSLSIVLLPIVAIIIIIVVTLISIGFLPLVSVIGNDSGLLLFVILVVVGAATIIVARFHESVENQELDELEVLRSRLEERVDERTRYARIAADIVQEIASSSSSEELLKQAVDLIAARLKFNHVNIYLTDATGRSAVLKAAHGSEAGKLMQAGKQIAFGSSTLIGWVAENKQLRIASTSIEDPLRLENEFLPESRAELSLPILSRDLIIGVLDVQSARSTGFDNEIIIILQTLADQIATVIQNRRLFEVEQGSIQEVVEVYVAGNRIVQAKTDIEIHQTLQELFSKISYVSMFLTPDGEGIKAVVQTVSQLPGEQQIPESIPVSMDEIKPFMSTDIFIGEGNRLNALPYSLVRVLQQLEIFSVALIPVIQDESITALLLIGTREKIPLVSTDIKPYISLTKQIATTLDRNLTSQKIEKQISDMESTNLQLQTITELACNISTSLQPGDVFEAVQRIFQDTSNAAILLIAEKNKIRIALGVKPEPGEELAGLPEWLDISPANLLESVGNQTIVTNVSKLSSVHYAQFHPELSEFVQDEANKLPVLQPALLKIVEQSQFQNVAIIPVMRENELATLLVVGTHDEQPILPQIVSAYANVAELVTATIEHLRESQKTEHRITEMETITTVSQEISTINNLQSLYSTLGGHIRQTLGNVNFLIALYDQSTNSISIPYRFERDALNDNINIDTFPVGEGLISILIRTKQPLMLVEDTEKRALSLGAKIIGNPAKSWLGTPMIVSGDVIGVIVVQDMQNEFAFDENDLRFLNTLSVQVAGTIHNTHLMDEIRSRAIQLQTAAEIARDISGSLDLGELLNKSVTLICERFNFYHASVFLTDAANEFAVIRDATGEAGTQMKRAGHKLKVGSKSIVGFVTGSGEPLIVNDTARDSTYYANPLLPETRAELALPLKVGPRILGALDVQSVQAYSFSEENINVLKILADQLAIAVINSELFAATQEHLSQHRLLHHVTTAAASGTTLEEALNGATQGLQVTLGGDRVTILLTDKDKKVLTVKSFAGYSEEIGQLEVPFGEGITGWVAAHQQPQRINDVTRDSRYLQMGSNVRSELAIPLMYRGEVLGVLNVESDQIGAYNENDEELLGTLGGSLAAIIANARLIEQVRRQVERERMLYEVTSKIRRSTDMQTIMATTTGELSKVLGARRAQIKIDLGSEPNQGKPK